MRKQKLKINKSPIISFFRYKRSDNNFKIMKYRLATKNLTFIFTFLTPNCCKIFRNDI